MYYLVTVGYQEETEKGTKVKKEKYVIESESIEETTIVAAKYVEGDTRDSQLLAVVNLPVETFISPSTNPEYYK